MPSTPEEEREILTQVCRTRGQIDVLGRSLEGDAEYHTMLQQVAAIRGTANGLTTEVPEGHIREVFDRDDCYSREVSQSVDDTIELVRAYLRQLNLLLY